MAKAATALTGAGGGAGTQSDSSASLAELQRILQQALKDTTDAAKIQTPLKVAIGTVNGAKQP
jgi:hypothetical protein